MHPNYSPEFLQLQKIMSSPEIQRMQEILSSPEYQQAQKIMHVTSKTDIEVAKKIAEVSQKVFEKNREAYRILANKWKKLLIL